MSKTVGKVLAVATIVVGIAAAAATGGASLGLTAAGWSALGIGVAAASMLNSAILRSKAKSQLQVRQASVIGLQLGEVPREVLFGEPLTQGGIYEPADFR